jgi:hypothetical protein
MLKRTILAFAFFPFLLTTSTFARTWVVNIYQNYGRQIAE